MKKAMLHTKVMVRLRKAENRKEWFLYLEAYPVFKAGNDKPVREREYLNRSITTPQWDQARPTRGANKGEPTFLPKRDMNGVIICRSKVDRPVSLLTMCEISGNTNMTTQNFTPRRTKRWQRRLNWARGTSSNTFQKSTKPYTNRAEARLVIHGIELFRF